MGVSSYAQRAATARAPTLFARAMGSSRARVGTATLGVWVTRSWGGQGWFVAKVLALGGLIGLGPSHHLLLDMAFRVRRRNA